MPRFTTESLLPRPPAEVFTYITNLENWTTFTGYGPLPGIKSATAPGPLALGTSVRVQDTDGTTHNEVITLFEPPHRYAVRMELVPPASYLMAHILEEINMHPYGQGTKIVRTFTTVPRNAFTGFAVWLITFLFLRPAVQKHDATVLGVLGAPK